MTNLNKVNWLLPKNVFILFASLLLLPLIHGGLILMGYLRLKKWMEMILRERQTDKFASNAELFKRAREIARIVSIAAQYGFYRATCLRRSLLVWWLLREEGIQSEIYFGVRTSNRMLEAHAWVECHGLVVNDSSKVHEQYRVLEDISSTMS